MTELQSVSERACTWVLGHLCEEQFRQDRPWGPVLYHSCISAGEWAFEYLEHRGMMQNDEWTAKGREMLIKFEEDFREALRVPIDPALLPSDEQLGLHNISCMLKQFGWWKPNDPRKAPQPARDAAIQLLVHLGLMTWQVDDWAFTATGEGLLDDERWQLQWPR